MYDRVQKRNDSVRVKTDARRQAIVATAWEVFKNKGFEGATMSEVSERMGGSKATLYGYYKSKEELFAAALEQAVKDQTEEAFRRLAGEGELRARLLAFATAYLATRLTPDMVGVTRAMMASADRSDLGMNLLERLIRPHWRRLADALGQEMAAGRLRVADPYVAAIHFRGLVEGDLLERALHGDDQVSMAEAAAAASLGVDAFLRAYDRDPTAWPRATGA